MKTFQLPDPGEGLQEADIVRWLVAEGDTVAVNDILIEIETAKSLVELPSPWAGTVGRLLVAEGDTVPIGTDIITILEPGEDASAAAPQAPAAPEAPQAPAPTQPDAAASEPQAPAAQKPIPPEEPAQSGNVLVGYGSSAASVSRRPRKGAAASVPSPARDQVHESYDLDHPVSRPVDQTTTTPRNTATPSGAVLPQPGTPHDRPDAIPTNLAKPAVRRLARDLGVDLATIVGTGEEGVMTPTDVAAAATAGMGRPIGGIRRIPLRGVHREMVRTMTESWKTPQASAWVDADVTGTVELIEQLKARREFAGLRVSPLLVFAKAACLAIARHPLINAAIDTEKGEIIAYDDVNLGIAAATPRGLIVPNVKRANHMNLVQLAEALNAMVAVAREGRITPADCANGTFTITNVGVFGVDGGTPILNPGESAIMCLGTIRRKPWVVGEGKNERIETRSVCSISLSFDHRVVDGELASRFLSDVATILAEPGLSLLF